MANVIIAGLGEVGRYLTNVFQQQNDNVTIMDFDPAVVASVEENHDVRSFSGNITNIKNLKAAEIDQADLFIAVTSSDDVNFLSAIMAKSLGAKKTIARISHQDFTDNPTGYYHNYMGVDLIINPDLLAAKQAENFIRSGSANQVETFADNRVEFSIFTISQHQSVVDTLVRDLKLPKPCIIAAIIRDNEMIRPGGTDIILNGDRLLIFSLPEHFTTLEELFGDTEENKGIGVTILGAGDLGLYLARSEDKISGHNSKIIEKDREKCFQIAENLKTVSVINGDATRIEFLNEEHIGDSDIFIATTRNDEVNLLSCLLAKDLGVKRTASIVHKPDYAPIFQKLGIDRPISPRLFAAKEIVRFIQAGEVSHVTTVENGKAEIIEMVASKESRIVQVPIHELTLPRGAQIIALKSEHTVIFPNGSEQIKPNDQVVIFTSPENRRYIENLFRKKLFQF